VLDYRRAPEDKYPAQVDDVESAFEWLLWQGSAGSVAALRLAEQGYRVGVIDARLRVFGYQNMIVCDGAALPANPGVNPALTITAPAEYAMEHVPARLRATAPDRST
jgi:choline dehydrogenase-like flavoprotein